MTEDHRQGVVVDLVGQSSNEVREHGLGLEADEFALVGPQLLVGFTEAAGAFTHLLLERLVEVFELRVALDQLVFQRDVRKAQTGALLALMYEGDEAFVVPGFGQKGVDIALVDGIDDEVDIAVAGEEDAETGGESFTESRQVVETGIRGVEVVVDDSDVRRDSRRGRLRRLAML